MNTMKKWASTLAGASALGAALLTSGSAKANCGDGEDIQATSANTWVQAADYCAGGGNYAYVNYEADYDPTFFGTGFGANQATSFSTSNGASFYIAAEVHCSDGGYYYNTGDYVQFTTAPQEVIAWCPSGKTASTSWAFAYLPSP